MNNINGDKSWLCMSEQQGCFLFLAWSPIRYVAMQETCYLDDINRNIGCGVITQ